MRTVTEESLRRRLARLESALESEKARLRKVCGGIPWGAVPNVPPHSEGRTN